jgi:hypothetical protein
MAELVYILCAVTSIGCAILLLRGYLRSASKLLFWSGLCFLFLSLNNIVLVVDLLVFPNVSFYGQEIRNLFSSIAGSLLLFGLIWEIT